MRWNDNKIIKSDEEYEENEVSGDEEMNSSDDETEYTDKQKPKKKA